MGPFFARAGAGRGLYHHVLPSMLAYGFLGQINGADRGYFIGIARSGRR